MLATRAWKSLVIRAFGRMGGQAYGRSFCRAPLKHVLCETWWASRVVGSRLARPRAPQPYNLYLSSLLHVALLGGMNTAVLLVCVYGGEQVGGRIAVASQTRRPYVRIRTAVCREISDKSA